MKLQYLGTAAAEGVPALYCTCEVCRRSRAAGGRNIRTRSQALVDGELLIDFCADTYCHMLREGLDLSAIENCIVTHSHSDHLYPADLEFLIPGFAILPEGHAPFTMWGSEDIEELVGAYVERTAGVFRFAHLSPDTPTKIGNYLVTPLRAWHGTAHPYIYIVERDGKRLLYGNDTDLFPEETWEYLSRVRPVFDLVSLDCTGGAHEDLPYHGHMSLGRNRACRERLTEIGCATEKTEFVLNHFSHNGLDADYDRFAPIAEKEGFMTSFDGMTVEF